MEQPSSGAEERLDRAHADEEGRTRPPRPYPFGGLAFTLALGLGCGGALPPPPPLRTGPTEVVWWTSPDGRQWARQPGPLAEHFVSLGLSVRDDGALWVTGIDQAGAERSRWDRTFGDPKAGGLVFDGETWTQTAWPVASDAPALLDPQWLDDTLWYVARDGHGGDPAEAGPVRIESAPPQRTWLTAAGTTDPSAARFGDTLHLFVSQMGRGVVHFIAGPDGALAEVQAWGRLQVPSAVVVDGELWLVAQQNIQAQRQPVAARSRDGQRFSSFERLLPPGEIAHCTSPVMGPHPRGGWVLLCVSERPPEGPP